MNEIDPNNPFMALCNARERIEQLERENKKLMKIINGIRIACLIVTVWVFSLEMRRLYDFKVQSPIVAQKIQTE